jgi:hypothetical protein
MNLNEVKGLQTYPTDAQMHNQVANGIPETPRPLAVCEPKAQLFPKVVQQLTCPLMPKSMEDRHCPGNSTHEAVQKTPFHATALRGAGDVIQQTHNNVVGDVLE